MKRKINKSPTAILTADWHIRGDRPICRTDDYMGEQKRKVEFIFSIANKYNCPIFIAGDIGNKPMWGDKLLNWFIEINSRYAYPNIITVTGQHDLPNHRLDKWEEAGIGVLNKSLRNFELEYDYINYTDEIQIHFFSYSKKIKETGFPPTNVVLIHQMVIKSQKDKLWETQEAQSAKRLLKKFPCYDLIVSGDNHQSFAVEYEGRWLVNPGSLMRMSANQIDHRPSVYLWYAEDNSIERVYLPIQQRVISREHIEIAEERNSRIESFVNRLKETEELGLSYEKNMEEFLKVNKIKKRIVEKIWRSM